MPLAAAIQLCSTSDKQTNIEDATRWISDAARAGATFIALPETFNWMGPEAQRQEAAEPLGGPTLQRMAELSRTLNVTLLAGSILERPEPPAADGRLYNTSVLFGPSGEVLATYRKMHLFDVELPGEPPYRESAAVAPGPSPVVADTPFGKLGLSICYDLRFPELYRALSEQGATVLAVPSAFTLATGKDHWEVLVRARAIENLCHVIAPAQWGRHSSTRVTYGSAMIVDPWGTVVARASERPGYALGPIDPALTEAVRTRLPSLAHRRLTTHTR